MTTELLELLRQKDPDDLAAYLDRLNKEHFSLVTLIDALSTFLVMESNLRFGSFHLIKMSLFLRKLSQSGLLSQATEAGCYRNQYCGCAPHDHLLHFSNLGKVRLATGNPTPLVFSCRLDWHKADR